MLDKPHKIFYNTYIISFGGAFMKWLFRLDYKYVRYALQNLMYYIVGGMAVMFVMNIVLTANGTFDIENGESLYALLSFDRALIMQGQVWRLISFIFLPPESSTLFMVFALYFYYHIGTSLEASWSSFRFNAYYLIGVIGTIIFGFVTGYTTNFYLNMSLFFAYAMLFPEEKLMLFFFIPVKIKYLALLDAAFFVLSFITAFLPYKVALLVAVGNFLLFFWDDMINFIKTSYSNYKVRKSFRR